MSVNCVAWVLDHSESKGNDRCVLLAIADEADAEGFQAFPGQARIAHRARVAKSTVIRSTDRLEALGELLVNRPDRQGRGHHNRYVLVMGRDPVDLLRRAGWDHLLDQGTPVPEGCQSDTLSYPQDPAGKGVTEGGNGVTQREKGVIRDLERSAQVTPNPRSPGPVDPVSSASPDLDPWWWCGNTGQAQAGEYTEATVTCPGCPHCGRGPGLRPPRWRDPDGPLEVAL